MGEGNIYKQLREATESDERRALSQIELAAIFQKEGNPISQSQISKLENSKKDPPTESTAVIKAYATHFNVTSDYLLGLRKTKSIDENLAMISRTTGLDETSINTLKLIQHYKPELYQLLNFIMKDSKLFLGFLNELSLYVNNDYIPIFYDEKSGSYIDSRSHGGVLFGKKTTDNKGNPGWSVLATETNILESHAMLQIQNILSEWKKRMI